MGRRGAAGVPDVKQFDDNWPWRGWQQWRLTMKNSISQDENPLLRRWWWGDDHRHQRRRETTERGSTPTPLSPTLAPWGNSDEMVVVVVIDYFWRWWRWSRVVVGHCLISHPRSCVISCLSPIPWMISCLPRRTKNDIRIFSAPRIFFRTYNDLWIFFSATNRLTTHWRHPQEDTVPR